MGSTADLSTKNKESTNLKISEFKLFSLRNRKWVKKNEQSLRSLQNTIKQTTIMDNGSLRGRGKKEIEIIFEEIMATNFPNFMNMNLHIQAAQLTPNSTN